MKKGIDYIPGLELARKIVKEVLDDIKEQYISETRELTASFYGQYVEGVKEHSSNLDAIDAKHEAVESALTAIDCEIERREEKRFDDDDEQN